jgi:hypothetical protein
MKTSRLNRVHAVGGQLGLTIGPSNVLISIR